MENQKLPRFVEIGELRLGDVVTLDDPRKFPFDTCIVKQVSNGVISLYRPYGISSNYAHTRGVSCYMGAEEFDIHTSSTYRVQLWTRKECS